jgi:hypothetical protein
MPDRSLTDQPNPGPPVPDADRGMIPVRRIVTGHDEQGRSTVLSDEASPHILNFPSVPDYGSTELWSTPVPADNATMGISLETPRMGPPEGGAVFRIVQFPPDKLFLDEFDRDSEFNNLAPDAGAHVNDADVSNSTMHRTRSVDFAVVIQGEVWAVLDTGDVRLGVGDTLIQRGTLHGWSNRTDAYAMVGFVLVDAVELGS